MAAAGAAIVLANSPSAGIYGGFLETRLSIELGEFGVEKPLLLWINDGLMAIFFFVVGLELKRELLEGRLSNPDAIRLPALAAVGGMLLPALVYLGLNYDDPLTRAGWAIPAATDIAFALGVLALLGDRVPPALKLFLLAVAVLDDLGAIVIIALFYTGSLALDSLWMSSVAVLALAVLNRLGVGSRVPYLLVGLVLWLSVLKSGVHATLAGVLLAAFIPLRDARGREAARELEHELQPWVSLLILPLFAFANAGVSFAGMSFSDLLEPVPLGIAAGLLLGKQLGVLGFCWLAIRTGFAKSIPGVGWLELWGVAALCGIGFTMSLFIGSLAFENAPQYLVDVRLGILSGTLLCAALGYGLLRWSTARRLEPGRAALAPHRA